MHRAYTAHGALDVIERLDQLGRELARVERQGPAGELDVELRGDLDLELAPIEGAGRRARGAGEHRRDRRPARPGPRRERLPHPALEDPGADAITVDAEEGDVGAVREQLAALDLGPDCGEVEPLELLGGIDGNRALRVADRDVLEAPLAT